MSEWFVRSFGEDYKIVYRHRDWEQAEHEVGRLAARLGLAAGARIADIGCGMGRHSLALSRLGYEVSGLDLSSALLQEARSQPGSEAVRWYEGDMRRMPFADAAFDAAVNLFTSFGYFEEDREHLQVLRELRRILKPGGRFVIDFLNAEQVRRSLLPESSRVDEETGTVIVENRFIEHGRVVKKIELTDADGGEARRYTESVRLLGEPWFRSALAEAGLALETVNGGYEGEPYEPERSRRLVLFGRRP
ncbi:class I SAM-dependent methyltransferase [Paenibacillus albicereus]|uniref:Class I SAM-dependent methyltransferase n=1 Tax=Paenibacillus albicereus TaxID=2726185 RepID=A0A6H2GZY7_9BACL|nr:class I SAM-dependent methyltransferase [Paenibacillus albicereus]QJC52980.1 class I SAM-dependent methyltransferase [Paenibacillus albicereus]